MKISHPSVPPQARSKDAAEGDDDGRQNMFLGVVKWRWMICSENRHWPQVGIQYVLIFFVPFWSHSLIRFFKKYPYKKLSQSQPPNSGEADFLSERFEGVRSSEANVFPFFCRLRVLVLSPVADQQSDDWLVVASTYIYAFPLAVWQWMSLHF